MMSPARTSEARFALLMMSPARTSEARFALMMMSPPTQGHSGLPFSPKLRFGSGHPKSRDGWRHRQHRRCRTLAHARWSIGRELQPWIRMVVDEGGEGPQTGHPAIRLTVGLVSLHRASCPSAPLPWGWSVRTGPLAPLLPYRGAGQSAPGLLSLCSLTLGLVSPHRASCPSAPFPYRTVRIPPYSQC